MHSIIFFFNFLNTFIDYPFRSQYWSIGFIPSHASPFPVLFHSSVIASFPLWVYLHVIFTPATMQVAMVEHTDPLSYRASVLCVITLKKNTFYPCIIYLFIRLYWQIYVISNSLLSQKKNIIFIVPAPFQLFIWSKRGSYCFFSANVYLFHCLT